MVGVLRKYLTPMSKLGRFFREHVLPFTLTWQPHILPRPPEGYVRLFQSSLTPLAKYSYIPPHCTNQNLGGSGRVDFRHT